MNREIEFRAIRSKHGGFAYGFYAKIPKGRNKSQRLLDGNKFIHVIIDEDGCYCEVDPETVGQYTGLKDKNGKEIYEGDILKCHEYDSRDTVRRIVQTFESSVVVFSQGSFYHDPSKLRNCPHALLIYAYEPEVIGNIHKNPELLKQ